MSNKCITQVFKDNAWKDTAFEDLKRGDKFRQIVNDTLKVDEDGKSEFIAFSDPYMHNGVWEIEYE